MFLAFQYTLPRPQTPLEEDIAVFRFWQVAVRSMVAFANRPPWWTPVWRNPPSSSKGRCQVASSLPECASGGAAHTILDWTADSELSSCPAPDRRTNGPRRQTTRRKRRASP